MDGGECVSGDAGRLGRRHIKGFAGGIARKFAVSAEHYAWVAYRNRIDTVKIDLLSLRVEPPVFGCDRNRNLAAQCRRTLLDNMRLLAPPSAVVEALLIARFGIEEYRQESHACFIGRSDYRVILTDDSGKQWRGESHAEQQLIAE